MIKSFEKNKRRWSTTGIVVILIMSILFLTNADNIAKANVNVNSSLLKPGRTIDKIDYPFINDNNVKGLWKYVDIVKNIKDFIPGEKSWKGKNELSSLEFYNKGKIGMSIYNSPIKIVPIYGMKWTKGIVIHFGDKTASHYTITSINSNEYMFFEWKNGDYLIRHVKPVYYVLKKVK